MSSFSALALAATLMFTGAWLLIVAAVALLNDPRSKRSHALLASGLASACLAVALWPNLSAGA